MTKHELIDAYVGGELDRRDFVRRLTALGVSAGAALAYAQTLAPRAAAASGGPSHGGFIVRAQADGDYGSPISADEIADALQLLFDLANYILALVQAGLAAFSTDDLEAAFAGLPDALNTIVEQIQLQIAALQGTSQTFGKRAIALQADPGDTIDLFLGKLQDAFDTATAVYAGTAPVITDGESRVTVTSISLVVARTAAYIRTVNGEPAFPAAFEEALSVADGRARLTELQGS